MTADTKKNADTVGVIVLTGMMQVACYGMASTALDGGDLGKFALLCFVLFDLYLVARFIIAKKSKKPSLDMKIEYFTAFVMVLSPLLWQVIRVMQILS